MKASIYPVLILTTALGALSFGLYQMMDEPKQDVIQKGSSVEEQPKALPVEAVKEEAVQEKPKEKPAPVLTRVETPKALPAEVKQSVGPLDGIKVVSADADKREKLKSISSRIEALWRNADGKTPSYAQKKMVIHKLGKTLSPEEREALYDYLRNGPSHNVYDLAIIDRLMIHLENTPEIAPEYVANLIDISKDTVIDGSVRGYVIQHLEDAYQARPILRKPIEEAFYAGLADTSTDVSGTSVQVLTLLSKQFPGQFDEKKIALSALSMAEKNNTWHPSRITAISVVGKLGVKEALPTVRKQAEKGARVTMKLAAIHSLGQLGDEEDIPFLEEILANPEKKFFAIAAQKALDRLQKDRF